MANINEIRNLAEPLKGYQFRITISNPPGSGASVEVLSFRCTAAAIPGKSIEEVMVNLGGFNVKYAGRSIPVGSWTTSFVEGTDLSVVERIKSWQELCHNQATGVQQNADGYKRTATIELLNNAKEVTKSYRIVGVWPQDLPDIGMDTASSDAIRVDCTWAYDHTEEA